MQRFYFVADFLFGCGNTDSSKTDTEKITENISSEETQEQKEKQAEPEEQEEDETQSQTVTGDLSVDVENGVLYSTEDGRISDKDGNPLSEYDYITITDNGSLSDSEGILEGYFVGAGGKIILDIPERAKQQRIPEIKQRFRQIQQKKRR